MLMYITSEYHGRSIHRGRLMHTLSEYHRTSMQGVGWCCYQDNIDDTRIDAYFEQISWNIDAEGSGVAVIGLILMILISI